MTTTTEEHIMNTHPESTELDAWRRDLLEKVREVWATHGESMPAAFRDFGPAGSPLGIYTPLDIYAMLDDFLTLTDSDIAIIAPAAARCEREIFELHGNTWPDEIAPDAIGDVMETIGDAIFERTGQPRSDAAEAVQDVVASILAVYLDWDGAVLDAWDREMRLVVADMIHTLADARRAAGGVDVNGHARDAFSEPTR